MSGIISDNIGRSSGLVKEAGGGGAILQVKVGQYFGNTATSYASTTPTWLGSIDSDFSTASSVAITPASTASKFQISFQCPILYARLGAVLLYRDIGGAGYTQLTGGAHAGEGTNGMYSWWNSNYWDAPNTTSVVTYRQYAAAYGAYYVHINEVGETNSIRAGIVTYVVEYDGSIVTIST